MTYKLAALVCGGSEYGTERDHLSLPSALLMGTVLIGASLDLEELLKMLPMAYLRGNPSTSKSMPPTKPLN